MTPAISRAALRRRAGECSGGDLPLRRRRAAHPEAGRGRPHGHAAGPAVGAGPRGGEGRATRPAARAAGTSALLAAAAVVESAAPRDSQRRKTGVNPARSRHCHRGASLIRGHGPTRAGRPGHAAIREPGHSGRRDRLLGRGPRRRLRGRRPGGHGGAAVHLRHRPADRPVQRRRLPAGQPGPPRAGRASRPARARRRRGRAPARRRGGLARRPVLGPGAGPAGGGRQRRAGPRRRAHGAVDRPCGCRRPGPRVPRSRRHGQPARAPAVPDRHRAARRHRLRGAAARARLGHQARGGRRRRPRGRDRLLPSARAGRQHRLRGRARRGGARCGRHAAAGLVRQPPVG